MAIEALEQEPCEDAVSRSYLLDNSWEVEFDGEYIQVVDVGTIFEASSVQPKAKTGRWIKKGNTLKCPFCGAKGEDIKDDYCFNYCPNCGSKMVEPQESEE